MNKTDFLSTCLSTSKEKMSKMWSNYTGFWNIFVLFNQLIKTINQIKLLRKKWYYSNPMKLYDIIYQICQVPKNFYWDMGKSTKFWTLFKDPLITMLEMKFRVLYFWPGGYRRQVFFYFKSEAWVKWRIQSCGFLGIFTYTDDELF